MGSQMSQRWPHKYSSKLTAPLSATSTQIALAVAPVLGVGEWCHLTLEINQGGVLVDEIVKADQTASGLVLTRALYSSTARAWPVGTPVECRIVEADLKSNGATTERITSVSLDPITGVMTMITGQ